MEGMVTTTEATESPGFAGTASRPHCTEPLVLQSKSVHFFYTPFTYVFNIYNSYRRLTLESFRSHRLTAQGQKRPKQTSLNKELIH